MRPPTTRPPQAFYEPRAAPSRRLTVRPGEPGVRLRCFLDRRQEPIPQLSYTARRLLPHGSRSRPGSGLRVARADRPPGERSCGRTQPVPPQWPARRCRPGRPDVHPLELGSRQQRPPWSGSW
ncbi:DUF6207 family protein [Streptomyces sp. NBC_01092]|uniref:DUF6207 family protein n=1 Tax=Streptomyces sp. NBC_01092 TaxID=2903748 RepID=UPI00386D97CF|nr:DUF6207 family protein [Streptomyces sp. NBC_01092]